MPLKADKIIVISDEQKKVEAEEKALQAEEVKLKEEEAKVAVPKPEIQQMTPVQHGVIINGKVKSIPRASAYMLDMITHDGAHIINKKN